MKKINCIFFFLEITSETEELCEKPEYENKEMSVEEDAKASQTYSKVFITAIYMENWGNFNFNFNFDMFSAFTQLIF